MSYSYFKTIGFELWMILYHLASYPLFIIIQYFEYTLFNV